MGTEPKEHVVDLLYKYTRNPLAHNLGVGKAAHVAGFHGRQVLMQKPGYGLPRATVIELMRGDKCAPQDVTPVIRKTAHEYAVNVPGGSPGQPVGWFGTCSWTMSKEPNPSCWQTNSPTRSMTRTGRLTTKAS